jgi:RNA polymerase sigma-70 factor (sigma-E family)
MASAHRAGGESESDAELAALLADNLEGLVRFAYFIVGDRDLADDVTAEAIERVLPHWRTGSVDDPMPYLRRAVVNTASNRHRRRQLEDRGAGFVVLKLAQPESPEDAVVERDEMWRALRRLSVPQRAIVVLRYYEDLSEEVIAELLDISVGTVKSRSHRALKQLHRELDRSRRGTD